MLQYTYYACVPMVIMMLITSTVITSFIVFFLRDLRPTSLDKGQETYRLVLYELYAWGGPLIIVSVGTIMDQLLNDKYPAVLRPNFGHHSCWFKGKSTNARSQYFQLIVNCTDQNRKAAMALVIHFYSIVFKT